jgi:hypothetical protein
MQSVLGGVEEENSQVLNIAHPKILNNNVGIAITDLEVG